MPMVQLVLSRPYTVIVLSMLIALLTPFVLLNMATDFFAGINIPVVSIIWNCSGLSAREMGQRIAAQSDRGLTITVSDIEHIESQSLPGITSPLVIKYSAASIPVVQLALSGSTLRPCRPAACDWPACSMGST